MRVGIGRDSATKAEQIVSENGRFLDILLVLLKDQRSFVSPLSPSVIMLADEGNPAPYSSRFGPARATAMCFQLRDKRCPREWIAFLMVFCPLEIRLPEVSRTAPGAWMQVTASRQNSSREMSPPWEQPLASRSSVPVWLTRGSAPRGAAGSSTWC